MSDLLRGEVNEAAGSSVALIASSFRRIPVGMGAFSVSNWAFSIKSEWLALLCSPAGAFLLVVFMCFVEMIYGMLEDKPRKGTARAVSLAKEILRRWKP